MIDTGAVEIAEVIERFIHLYSEQNERHMAALLQALELIDDSIQKGFSDVEEQLENIGDAIRELEPSDSSDRPYSDSNRSDQNKRADN